MEKQKNIAIVILALIIIAMAGFILLKGDSAYKKKVEELQAENSVLHFQRDSINSIIADLEKDYKEIEKRKSYLASEVNRRSAEAAKQKEEADCARTELQGMKTELEKTRESINDRAKKPANRTGSDLINSLKIKTGK